jgi:addiction module HigA family antidote
MYLRPNIHPGEILREEFLKPSGVDIGTLAHELNLPQERLESLVECRGNVNLDTALRLSHYFGTSERFWLEMQLTYDLQGACGTRRAVQEEVTPHRVA